MLLSIILPVYNVEMYLSACLDSCLSQNLNSLEYEIIAVNDGSTDNSLNILNKYVTEFSNIKILNQNNQGLSMARNNGLSMAKGDYIWFVDSDDFIKPNCLLDIFNVISDSDVDVLAIDWIEYNNQTLAEKKKIREKCNTSKSYIGGDFLEIFDNEVSAWAYLWNRIYLVKNKLMFSPNLLHEDLLFTPIALYFAKQVKYFNICAYYYRVFRQNSITNVSKPKRSSDLLKIAICFDKFINSESMNKHMILIFSKLIGTCIVSSVRHAFTIANVEERKMLLDLYVLNRHLYKRLIRRSNFLFFIEGLLWGINPKLYCYIDYFIHRKF
ncbi:glycosyltransferase [uncultured Parabacteroides sp.]|uniref:glycosyltransferase n=1 Tax=uncultured Parabacteroides sp. TaxID=512312 RepID=UPI00266055D2|nr:glycosyltransferase [uncultured Parabacteroides sp.]